MLGAALAIHPVTRNLTTDFKAISDKELDLLIKNNSVLVHEKWLEYHGSHEKSPCWLSQRGADIENFTCDHIILDLYDSVLQSLRSCNSYATDDSPTVLVQRVDDTLRQMPRNVKFEKVKTAGELTVSWTDAESKIALDVHGIQLKCKVTLHRESTCASKRDQLLNTDGKFGTLLILGIITI